MTSKDLPGSFPNFIVIGASKCGTSSLYAYLKQHPEIFLSHVKETHFFSYGKINALGPEAFVSKYYPDAHGYKAIGDITPTYFVQPDIVIPRIKEVYGKDLPKLILIMRNPIERAWSHYLHKVRSGEETESFESALRLEKERMQRDPLGWWGYMSEGLYATYLSKWLEVFPREQFLFLLTEDLATDVDAVLKSIYSYLGVDVEYKIKNRKRKNTSGAVRSDLLVSLLAKPSLLKNFVKLCLPMRYQQKLKTHVIELNTSKASLPPGMSCEQRELLKTKLIPRIHELERLTGMDLSGWTP